MNLEFLLSGHFNLSKPNNGIAVAFSPINVMPKVDKETYEIWKQYESIAMHFNDLLSKIRLQALGGVGTISVIVGVFSKDISECSRWIILGFAFVMLSILWINIW